MEWSFLFDKWITCYLKCIPSHSNELTSTDVSTCFCHSLMVHCLCAGRYQGVVWEVCQKSGCNSGRLSAEHTDEIRPHRHLFHSHWVPTRNGILRRKTNKSWSEEHSRDSWPIPSLVSTHTIQFNLMGVIKVLINNYWIN